MSENRKNKKLVRINFIYIAIVFAVFLMYFDIYRIEAKKFVKKTCKITRKLIKDIKRKFKNEQQY